MSASTDTRSSAGSGRSLGRRAKEGIFGAAERLNLGSALEDTARSLESRRGREHRAQAMDRGQLGLGTLLAAFVVVIAAFVVLTVVDQFDESVGTPSSSALSSSQNDILSGFSSMTSLIEPLLLIAIGVVIIGLIRRVQ